MPGQPSLSVSGSLPSPAGGGGSGGPRPRILSPGPPERALWVQERRAPALPPRLPQPGQQLVRCGHRESLVVNGRKATR